MTQLRHLAPGARFTLCNLDRSGVLLACTESAAKVRLDGTDKSVSIVTSDGQTAQFTRPGQPLTVAPGTEVVPEAFRLQPPKPERKPLAENVPTVQRVLISGGDCLPGQLDLF